jgi:ABC-type spermidine/putrescine transport system permease subunit II
LIIAVAILALGLLLMPVVVLMFFDTRLYISFPPQGFTLDWYRRVFAQPVLMGAMWTSIKVAPTSPCSSPARCWASGRPSGCNRCRWPARSWR